MALACWRARHTAQEGFTSAVFATAICCNLLCLYLTDTHGHAMHGVLSFILTCLPSAFPSKSSWCRIHDLDHRGSGNLHRPPEYGRYRSSNKMLLKTAQTVMKQQASIETSSTRLIGRMEIASAASAAANMPRKWARTQRSSPCQKLVWAGSASAAALGAVGLPLVSLVCRSSSELTAEQVTSRRRCAAACMPAWASC